MLVRRVLIEVSVIILLLCIAGYAVWDWDSLDCQIPFNIWVLVFSLILMSSQFMYLVVALAPTSYSIITALACAFFFFINPLIIIWTLTGIGFYITYLLMNDHCGSMYDGWIVLVFLSLSITNMILAILRSLRIYKSIVKDIQRYLRSNIREPYMDNLMNAGVNDSLSFTHEELSRMPAFRATGSIINNDCAICHEKILHEELLRNLPGCTHTYHQTCIDNWLRQHPTCPLCRNNVRLNFL